MIPRYTKHVDGFLGVSTFSTQFRGTLKGFDSLRCEEAKERQSWRGGCNDWSEWWLVFCQGAGPELMFKAFFLGWGILSSTWDGKNILKSDLGTLEHLGTLKHYETIFSTVRLHTSFQYDCLFSSIPMTGETEYIPFSPAQIGATLLGSKFTTPFW